MLRISIPVRILTVVGIITAFVATAPAVADQTCRNLEASLASISHGGDRTKLRRYDRAIISQKQQLERAKSRQSNSGCASFLSSIKPHCGEVRSTVAKMERNLLQLQRTRNELSGGNAAREKTRILAALDQNSCRGGVNRKDSPTGLYARLFGGDEQRREKQSGSRETREVSGNRITVPNGATPPGKYRTLCVRACDGYFFPIAYASSPRFFDRDTKACESMCPSTEVELFYHSVPDEEADAMVSAATGEPYSALPAAFDYRDPDYERPKACKCNPPKDFSIIAGNLPEQTEDDELRAGDETMVMPAVEKRAADPARDWKTRTNREGGVTSSALADLLAPKIAAKDQTDVGISAKTEAKPADKLDGERQIRVVGPAFLPDPEAAIDLRVPGRTELQ